MLDDLDYDEGLGDDRIAPAAIGDDGRVYEVGDRVWYVAHGAFDLAGDPYIDKTTVGLVSHVVNDNTVQVLWRDHDEVVEHHVMMITLAEESKSEQCKVRWNPGTWPYVTHCTLQRHHANDHIDKNGSRCPNVPGQEDEEE